MENLIEFGMVTTKVNTEFMKFMKATENTLRDYYGSY